MKVRSHRIRLPLREAIKLNGGKGLEKPKGKLNISYRNNWGIKSDWELKWIRQKQQEINQALSGTNKSGTTGETAQSDKNTQDGESR